MVLLMKKHILTLMVMLAAAFSAKGQDVSYDVFVPISKYIEMGDAEKLFDQNFGVTVQIKDKEGKACVPNNITIGQAARGEYK